MKKAYMGIFSIFILALTPLLGEKFGEPARKLMAEKGIFPPEEPSPTPPPQEANPRIEKDEMPEAENTNL